MIATRDQLLQMDPVLRHIYPDFENRVLAKGLNYRITCVARFRKEQVALYSQGRDDWATVQMYRQLAGMQPLNSSDYPRYDDSVKLAPGKNKYVVTWTLDSLHVIDLDDDISWNNFSRAFDIVILDKHKKATWDLKVDVDQDGVGDYLEAANIGKSVGLNPGAFFLKNGKPKPDYPHYQINVQRS